MLAFHQIRLPLHVHLIVDKSYQMPIKFTLPVWRAGVPKLLTSVQTCPWLRWSNAWYPTESPASNESLTSSSHARITSTEPETMAQS